MSKVVKMRVYKSTEDFWVVRSTSGEHYPFSRFDFAISSASRGPNYCRNLFISSIGDQFTYPINEVST